MSPFFSEDFSDPSHSFFAVLPFQRIYHNAYLNATRSARYRYNITEVRNYLDITVLKGQVYLDGHHLTNFLRLETRAIRLNELVREKNRFLREQIRAEITIPDEGRLTKALVKLHFDGWINAYQVEIWESLEAPARSRHDYNILDLMGGQGQITRIAAFSPFLEDLSRLGIVQVKFLENDRDLLNGAKIDQPVVDDNYNDPHQKRPIQQGVATSVAKYNFEFQRGWYVHIANLPVQLYHNDMMDQTNPDYKKGDNTIEKRWILGQELGGSLSFLNEVTIPPGKSEGVHHHAGTEIIYCFTQGRGRAFLAKDDDPNLKNKPEIEQEVFRLGPRRCKVVPVQANDVIFIKSGGTIGIKNTELVDLKYLSFMYYTA